MASLILGGLSILMIFVGALFVSSALVTIWMEARG